MDTSPSPAPDSRWRPWIAGLCGGLLLSGLLAVFCPESELQPGDSRVLMAVLGGIILVPGSIATAYAARSTVRSIRRMPILRFLWMADVLFFTLVTAIVGTAEWMESRAFIRVGRSVGGIVVETHPEDHDTLLVAYTVSGVDYRTRTAGPRVARSYRPGDAIQVYYLASAPAQGFCHQPRWRPGLLFTGWILAAGVLPLWQIGLFGTLALRMRPASRS